MSKSAVALSLAAACAASAISGSAFAQINFTVPADAPDGGNGFVGVLDVRRATPALIDNQNDARTVLSGSRGGNRTLGTASRIDFGEPGSITTPGALPFVGGGGDDFAQLYRGYVQIPTAGTYTFNVNSDDGYTVAFPQGGATVASPYGGTTVETYNGVANGAFQFFANKGPSNTGAQVNFPTAGAYRLEMTFHERGGGELAELTAASGARTGFDAGAFSVVGQQASTIRKGTGGFGQWNGNMFYNVPTFNQLRGAYNAAKDPSQEPPTNTPFTRSTIALVDEDNPNSGGHTPNGDFPGSNPEANDDNFGGGAEINWTPTTTGTYTLAVYSDDPSRNFITNSAGGYVPYKSVHNGAVGYSDELSNTPGSGTNAFGTNTNADGSHACCIDVIAQYDLTAGQTYELTSIFHEQGGGAGWFVYVAEGALTSFDASRFGLVGEAPTETTIPGGLLQFVAGPSVPEPAALGLLAAAGLFGLARRRRA